MGAMPQPFPYSRTATFAQDERANAGGRSTVNTAELDAEFDGVAASIGGIRSNLALNQRDDGEIRDGRVKLHTLGPDVLAFLTLVGASLRGSWVTSTAYAARDVVTQSGNTYICGTTHTSGVFADDFGAGLWLLLAQGTTGAGGIAFTPSANISGTNVQAAVVEVDTNNRALSASASALATGLRTDLASATDVAKGAALIGFNDPAGQFNGTKLDAVLAELGSNRGAFVGSGVNILRYISPDKWPAILAGTSTVDLKTELQAAFNAEPSLIFPDGLYNTSVPLVPLAAGCTIRGMRRRGATLKNTAGGAAIMFQVADTGAADNEVYNIYFKGANATGISVDKTTGSGSLKGYLVRAHVHHCDFDRELSFGIDADLIYGTIEQSTFGYYQTSGNAAFVGVKSYSVSSNFTNVNTIRDCFFTAGNSTTGFAIAISGGTNWRIERCGFEAGGQAILADFAGGVTINNCWFEALACGTGRVISLGPNGVASAGGATIRDNQFWTNACAEVINWDSLADYIVVEGNIFALAAGTYPMTDGQDGNHGLRGDNKLRWRGNNVSGGHASNRLRTSTDYATKWAVVNTTSPGTIIACSDADATIAYNGTGDVTVTFAHAFCLNASHASANVSGQTTWAQVAVPSTTTVRINSFADGNPGAATNGIIHLSVRGQA